MSPVGLVMAFGEADRPVRRGCRFRDWGAENVLRRGHCFLAGGRMGRKSLERGWMLPGVRSAERMPGSGGWDCPPWPVWGIGARWGEEIHWGTHQSRNFTLPVGLVAVLGEPDREVRRGRGRPPYDGKRDGGFFRRGSGLAGALKPFASASLPHIAEPVLERTEVFSRRGGGSGLPVWWRAWRSGRRPWTAARVTARGRSGPVHPPGRPLGRGCPGRS